MIENKYTNETAHVINWFLYSPHVDLESLVREAESEANKWAATRPTADADDIQNALTDALEYEVERAFLAAVGLDGESLEGIGYVGRDESTYRHCDSNWLLLTFIGATANLSICFDDVAEAVLAHVRQTAPA